MFSTAVFGESAIVFVLLLSIFLLCATLAGKIQAATWRKPAFSVFFGILIACAHRFLLFALRDAELFSFYGFLLSCIIFVSAVLLSYRYYQIEGMCNQYPWIYKKTSWFTCKNI